MGEYDALFDEPAPAAKKDRGDYGGLFDNASSPPRVDMGPAARRALAGSPSGPRDLTSEEAGTSAGMQRTSTFKPFESGPYTVSQAAEPAGAPSSDYVTRQPTPGGGEQIRASTGNPNEMADPLVQMGTAAAMGRAAAAPLAALPAPVAAVAAPAVEGGVANKAAGGDFTTGAAIGAAVPLVHAAKQAAAAGKEAISAGAVERVKARTVRNLTEEARKPTADKVARAAGEEGSRLETVVARNPELRRALAVQAKDRPAAALGSVDETLAQRNATLDNAYEQMEAHYADKPASAQASVPQILDDIEQALGRNKGDLDKTQAIRRAREAIVNEFGADGTITPNELRSLKRSIGRAAFPMGTAASTGVKAQVARDLYAPLSKQLETLAKNTPGLDSAAFMAANEDVATLIPVREALAERVDKIAQGKKTFFERAKESAHKLAALGGIVAGTAAHSPAAAVAVPAAVGAAKLGARVARGFDYRMAEAQLRRVEAAQAARSGATAAAPAVRPAPVLPPAVTGAAVGQVDRRGSIADLYGAPAM
jgi:hypothetical protein